MRKRLAVALCALAVTLAVPVPCLTAACEGARLFAWPIRAGECFEIRFIHSLNLSPITDVIEWTGTSLIVRKSIFQTFGAGVPVPADGIGTALVKIDGHYELIGIDKPLPASFVVMTADIPNHRVALGNREAFLTELAGTGKAVEIAVKRIPLAVRFLLFL